MSKGRNSWTITLRLPDNVRGELDQRAENAGQTLGLYLQSCIIRSVHATKVDVQPEVPPTSTKTYSVHTTREAVQPKPFSPAPKPIRAQPESNLNKKLAKAGIKLQGNRILGCTKPTVKPKPGILR